MIYFVCLLFSFTLKNESGFIKKKEKEKAAAPCGLITAAERGAEFIQPRRAEHSLMRRCQRRENHNICRVCVRGCWIKPPWIERGLRAERVQKSSAGCLQNTARGGKIRTAVFSEAFGEHSLLLLLLLGG